MSARLHPVATAGDQTVPAAMPIVRCLGKYRITGPGGEGARGGVYRALDPDIDRAVARKTIRRSGSRTSHLRAARSNGSRKRG